MAAIAIFGILSSIIYCLMMKFVFRVDMSRLTSFDIRKIEGMSNAMMSPLVKNPVSCMANIAAIDEKTNEKPFNARKIIPAKMKIDWTPS